MNAGQLHQVPPQPRVAVDPAGREAADGVVVVVHGQADLLQVVDALRPAGGLPRRLDRREQEGDQDRDDGDDDEQLDQREPAMAYRR